MTGYQPERFVVSYTYIREPWMLKNDALAHTANIIVHELAGLSKRRAPLSLAEMNSIVSGTRGAHLGGKETRHGSEIGDRVDFEVLLHGKKAFSLRTTIASPQTA